MDPAYASIIGLVFIILIVFTVLSAKTWHWVNIVFVNLCFLAAVGAAAGMAQVFDMKYTQQKDFEASEKMLETNREAARLAVYGSPDAIGYARGSLRGIAHELNLANTGQGRVWSGGTIAAAGTNRTFQFPTARPDDPAEQVALKDVILYAFADGMIDGQPYPQTYIGTVMVAAESPASVTLKSIFVADGKQWTQPTTTWSLFEKMPMDRHHTFKMGIIAEADSNPAASDAVKSLAESIRKGEMEIGPYREFLKARYLTPERMNLDPASPEYEALVDRYAFDGMSLGKIEKWIEANGANRINTRFQPPPEETFIEYRFKKNSKKTHKVNADGSIDVDGQFTQLGHAIDPALHAEKDVMFSEGDTVLVDQRTATGYQRGTDLVPAFADQEVDGSGNTIIEEVDRVYFRQLRDYPYMLVDLETQARKFAKEAARIRAGVVVQEKAFADAEVQLAARTQVIAGLQQDQGNLNKDLSVIQALNENRDGEIEQLESKIASLKQSIEADYARIQQLTEAIERRAFAGN
jgi:hypothetical protein